MNSVRFGSGTVSMDIVISVVSAAYQPGGVHSASGD